MSRKGFLRLRLCESSVLTLRALSHRLELTLGLHTCLQMHREVWMLMITQVCLTLPG